MLTPYCGHHLTAEGLPQARQQAPGSAVEHKGYRPSGMYQISVI